MLKLEYTETSNRWLRHKTWTRVGETHYRLSPLQNQFALAEVGLSEVEAVRLFRQWLWWEMQDEQGVVWRELAELATYHEWGNEVGIMVPKDAQHGAVIARALLWMVEHTKEVKHPTITSGEPGPNAEPILPDGVLSTPAEIEPKHLVWIYGRTQSRIGVIVEWGQAFVPEYGLIPLRKFRWLDHCLALSPQLQRLLANVLDSEFMKEADATPVEYESAPAYLDEERYIEGGWFWQQDEDAAWQSEALQLSGKSVEESLIMELLQETESVAIAANIVDMPDVTEWYYKRPPDNTLSYGDKVRPAYFHRGENAPLMVRGVEDQVEKRRFRYAQREEALTYQQTFGVEPAIVSPPQVVFENKMPQRVRELCQKSPYSACNMQQKKEV